MNAHKSPEPSKIHSVSIKPVTGIPSRAAFSLYQGTFPFIYLAHNCRPTAVVAILTHGSYLDVGKQRPINPTVLRKLRKDFMENKVT